MVVFLTLTQVVAVRICISQLICRFSITVIMSDFQSEYLSSILGICTNFALVMELVYILDSKSKFSRFESWLGYKINRRATQIGEEDGLENR